MGFLGDMGLRLLLRGPVGAEARRQAVRLLAVKLRHMKPESRKALANHLAWGAVKLAEEHGSEEAAEELVSIVEGIRL